MNYFEFLGLPRSLGIDAKDLEKRFYALSRTLHPDLHSRKSPGEREQAEQSTAILNDAYRTLRDPVARAEYLLGLEGFDTREQTTNDVPAELLEEVFDLNMALEDVRNGAEADIPQIESARRKFEGMQSEIDTELQQTFGQWDATGNRDALAAVRGLLNRRKYISNLIAKTNVPDRV